MCYEVTSGQFLSRVHRKANFLAVKCEFLSPKWCGVWAICFLCFLVLRKVTVSCPWAYFFGSCPWLFVYCSHDLSVPSGVSFCLAITFNEVDCNPVYLNHLNNTVTIKCSHRDSKLIGKVEITLYLATVRIIKAVCAAQQPEGGLHDSLTPATSKAWQMYKASGGNLARWSQDISHLKMNLSHCKLTCILHSLKYIYLLKPWTAAVDKCPLSPQSSVSHLGRWLLNQSCKIQYTNN